MDVKAEQRRRLQATTEWARRIRATLQHLLDAHGHEVHFRPSSTGVAMVGLLADRPQRGKSGLTNLDTVASNFDALFAAHCRDVEHGRDTGEKALQSFLIRESYRNGRTMPLGHGLVFVTDEISLPVEGGKIVCDVLALRRDGDRTIPVLLELKDSRMLTRLVAQVEGYARLMNAHPDLFAELYSAILGEPVRFDAPTEKWIVWPAVGADEPHEAELTAKRIRVVGYRESPRGYSFRVGRAVV